MYINTGMFIYTAIYGKLAYASRPRDVWMGILGKMSLFGQQVTVMTHQIDTGSPWRVSCTLASVTDLTETLAFGFSGCANLGVTLVDIVTPEHRSRIMRSIRSKDTGPELIVRKLVHRLGYRFRLHRRDLPGRPDLVFPGRRKVIFVHGCFWHQHPGCSRATTPKSNTAAWREKLERNQQRDIEAVNKLVKQGWSVLVIWECETKLKHESLLIAKLEKFFGAD